MLLFAISSFGQSNKKELSDIAFRFYMDKQFDSAAIYYEQVVELATEDNPAYYLGQLGDCYKKIGNRDRAKENYLKCLSDTAKSQHFSPKRDCAHGLADLYLKEEKYGEALRYLQLAENNFPHFRICSNGEFERETNLNYKFSQCFEGLNQIDSAIYYLTPYMFNKAENLLMDSLEYLQINEYYIGLLKKKYSDTEIKKQVFAAVDKIYYKKELDTEWEPISPTDKFYNVLCFFTLFGQKVIVTDSGYEANSWGGEPVLQYSKEYLIDYVKGTPTYKMTIK
jgi:tetratricopeptide (TPR) repeat protein